ncbi:hypothetical protein ABPG74_003975 [Tetrahymena malaccensis]
MGNQVVDKGIKPIVKKQFENLKSKQRDYLTVSEVIKFQHPENYQFQFDHLGNLFVLNSSRSGTFSIQEFYKFIEFCQNNLKNVKTYEFQSQLQAATTHVLLQYLQKENGENEIVDWVEQMLLKNEKNAITFERMGNTKFIGIQTVKILYEIFKIKMMNGMEIQQFFYLLQQCGEEAGLMAPDAKELDEYVPVEMGKEFARQYLRGFAKLMKEVGFNDDSSMQQDISMLEASLHNTNNTVNRMGSNQMDNMQGRGENNFQDYQRSNNNNNSGGYNSNDQYFEDEIDVEDADDINDEDDEDEEDEEEEELYDLNRIDDQDETSYNKFQNKFRYTQSSGIAQYQQQQRQIPSTNFNNQDNEVEKQKQNLEDKYKDNYFVYQQKQNLKVGLNSSGQKHKSQSINNSLSQYNQDQVITTQQKQGIVIPPLQVNLTQKGYMQNNLM